MKLYFERQLQFSKIYYNCIWLIRNPELPFQFIVEISVREISLNHIVVRSPSEIEVIFHMCALESRQYCIGCNYVARILQPVHANWRHTDPAVPRFSFVQLLLLKMSMLFFQLTSSLKIPLRFCSNIPKRGGPSTVDMYVLILPGPFLFKDVCV